jgi:hypothetical protein
MEIYRKRGSVVRYENGVLVHVTESGEATEDGARFHCGPSGGSAALPQRDPAHVRAVVSAIHASLPAASIERIVVIDGNAEHEFGGRTWSDATQRIHLSMVSASLRVVIDEGSFDTSDFGAISAALRRAGAPRSAPKRLRLAPRVTAALLPSLLGATPPNCAIEQRPGGVDGKGRDIAATSGPDWPNWYRPSYRVRPRRLPIDIALRCNAVDFDPDLPRAIALLGPPDGMTLHVLCDDGGESFATRIEVARIDGVGAPLTWHPVAAGVWAGEAEIVSR